jgi:serine/threonine protein kinase
MAMNDLLAIPTHITERFQVEREIGRGGFATVYLARDNNLGRKVAIKSYHIQSDDGSTDLGQEAHLLASLKHPNIVTVYDGGVAEGRPYIVMEYLSGGSLREKLDQSPKPMRPQDALGLVAVLAEALDAAHEADVLHLDIKPENIMFDQRGRPYLTDFGIGRVMGGDGETRQTRAMGTNNYASPEQRQGGKLSRASDIYSLGVVLFELLTHQLPLGPAAVEPQPPYSPPFPMNHPLTAARDLVVLVCKALAVAPQYRYESAHQLAQQLRNYCVQASGSTGRLSSPPVRQFTAPDVARVEIREPERHLRLADVRRVPRTVREMLDDLPPVPPGTRVNSMIYSHHGVEVGVGSVVEQAIFGRGRVRLRQDALVLGDVISLTLVDLSQGVQAANVLAPEVMIRGPVRMEGSIFCRRLRPAQSGQGCHLPENSELGGSLILGNEFEKIVLDEELGRPLKTDRQPIDILDTWPEVKIGTQCTLVAVLGEVNVSVEPRQKQLNTVRVSGNVIVGHSNTIRRIEGQDVHIGPGCRVDEVHARGELVIERGSSVGYVRAGAGIRLADNVVISSPVLFSDNGAIKEKGEAKWRAGKRLLDLTAQHIFDYTREDQRGSVAMILLDHRLYELYERIAPGWLPRLKPIHFEGSGQRVSQPAQPKAMPVTDGEFLHIEMDLTPASERAGTESGEEPGAVTAPPPIPGEEPAVPESAEPPDAHPGEVASAPPVAVEGTRMWAGGPGQSPDASRAVTTRLPRRED